MQADIWSSLPYRGLNPKCDDINDYILLANIFLILLMTHHNALLATKVGPGLKEGMGTSPGQHLKECFKVRLLLP